MKSIQMFSIFVSAVMASQAFGKDHATGLRLEILNPQGSLSSSLPQGKLKELDQMKYNKLQISSLKNLEEARALLVDIKSNDESLAEQYGLKKDYFRSVEIAVGLIDLLLQENQAIEEVQNNQRFQDLIQILTALRNRSESPKEESLEVFRAFGKLAEHLHKPKMSLPKERASQGVLNLQSLDPIIFQQEMVRQPLLDPQTTVCEYAGAKTGFGFKAGLKVKCGSEKFKLKFGVEDKSGPFNSRIFRSLGFMTPKIDFVPRLEMKYDRKFLTEFNSRKQTHTAITMLGRKVGQQDYNTEKRDGLSFITEIKLKNGRVLSGPELAAFKASLRSGGADSTSFNEDIESTIDTVIFRQGSVVQDLDVIEVGPWRFDEPWHLKNASLRQQLVLNMWLGNSDLPMNNNRLVVIGSKKSPSEIKVLPIYVDVGFGLGISNDFRHFSSSDIQHMSYSMSNRLSEDRIEFDFISKTPAAMLDHIQFDDAKEALKLMCRFDQTQLEQALTQAGFSPELSQKGALNLVRRRAKLIFDMGIQDSYVNCL